MAREFTTGQTFVFWVLIVFGSLRGFGVIWALLFFFEPGSGLYIFAEFLQDDKWAFFISLTLFLLLFLLGRGGGIMRSVYARLLGGKQI